MSDQQALPRLSRRDARAMLAWATASASAPLRSEGALPAESEPRKEPYLSLVSRHIQWTDAENGVAVAKEAGFPAILWTVRSGAHIEPDHVQTELPRIVGLTRAAGLDTPMQQLGIQLYRAAAPRYDYKKWKLEMPQETFIGYLKRDVGFYNDLWRATMTTPPPFSVKAGSGSPIGGN